jgi:hypothetical protein
MIKMKYHCIARDEHDKKLSSVSCHWEPVKGVRGRCIHPSFHRFVLSIFALHPDACKIEVMSLETWKPGVDVETLPWVLTASRNEEARAMSGRALAYRFPDTEVERLEAPL